MSLRLPLVLPCAPCPHDAACCSWGTQVLEHEREAIEAAHPGAVVWSVEEQEHRTRVVDGRCVFLVGARCSIHGESYYPSTCREFPWRDAQTGGPYQWDLSICPELGGS